MSANRFATLPKGDMSAQEFLGWSMDRYAELQTFAAKVAVKGLNGQQRQIEIELPNRFRIHSSRLNFEMTSICDGTKTIEYSSQADQPVMIYPAPASIAAADSMMMAHLMFCGSLLYRFFAGSPGLERLAWLERAPVEYGGSEKVAGGEIATEVKFYGREQYGNVVALIGLKTGLVQRLAYDSAELYAMMRSPEMRQGLRAATSKLSPWRAATASFGMWVCSSTIFKPRWTTHDFQEIVINQPVPNFDTAAPEGRETTDWSERGRPPVPIGEPAPDFTVRSPDGTPLKLSDLRGQVVFIDLWATWCGPCRMGLPDTMALAEEGAQAGFRVLAISNDDPRTIAEFVKEEGLGNLPVYADTGGEVWSKYKVTGIPTTIVVDAAGNLSAYMVGLRSKADLRAAIDAALKKLL